MLAPSNAPINFATSGDKVVVAAKVGMRILVIGFDFIANGTVNPAFWDGPSASGTRLSGPYPCTAQTGIVKPPYPFNNVQGQQGYWLGTTGNALIMNLDQAVQVSGSLQYLYVK